MTLCKCGCGKITNKEAVFIHGHNTRIAILPQRFAKGIVPWNKGKRGLYTLSTITREKISKANMGRHMPPGHLVKMMAARRKVGWRKGWKHSSDTLKKISLAQIGHLSSMKGKTLPIAWRQHISKGRKGIKFSASHRKNIRNARRQQIFTPETRYKLSVSMKKRSAEGRWTPPLKVRKFRYS